MTARIEYHRSAPWTARWVVITDHPQGSTTHRYASYPEARLAAARHRKDTPA